MQEVGALISSGNQPEGNLNDDEGRDVAPVRRHILSGIANETEGTAEHNVCVDEATQGQGQVASHDRGAQHGEGDHPGDGDMVPEGS